MRIIPVIDILNNLAVQAEEGERKNYEPINSVLTKSSQPHQVALKFEEMGFQEIYVADLNFIQKKGDNLEYIDKITSKTDLDVMVDGGFRTIEDVEPFIETGIKKVVLATETLRKFEEIRKVTERFEISVTGSIDIKNEKIAAKSSKIKKPFKKVIKRFEADGAEELIILNLSKVGTSSGIDKKYLKRALKYVNIPILAGGGVRNKTDLSHAEKIGASGVLVATALHNGSIKGNDFNFS